MLRGFIRPLFEALGWSPACLGDSQGPDHDGSRPCSRWALYTDDVQRQAAEYSQGSDDAELTPAMVMFVLDAGSRSDFEPNSWAFNDLALPMIAELMTTAVQWGDHRWEALAILHPTVGQP